MIGSRLPLDSHEIMRTRAPGALNGHLVFPVRSRRPGLHASSVPQFNISLTSLARVHTRITIPGQTPPNNFEFRPTRCSCQGTLQKVRLLNLIRDQTEPKVRREPGLLYIRSTPSHRNENYHSNLLILVMPTTLGRVGTVNDRTPE